MFRTFRLNVGIFYKILSVPHNIVMDLNNLKVCGPHFCFSVSFHFKLTFVNYMEETKITVLTRTPQVRKLL